MLLISFNRGDRTFTQNFPNQRIGMKNLIIVIHILLTLLLVGCADKGVYVGEKKDGKRHGQGKFKWSDGDKYVGEFKDGKQDGQGTYTHSDGRKYVGEWKDGKKHGYGTLTYLNGEKYYGEFKDGKRNGQGTLTKPNGDKYVGVGVHIGVYQPMIHSLFLYFVFSLPGSGRLFLTKIINANF